MLFKGIIVLHAHDSLQIQNLISRKGDTSYVVLQHALAKRTLNIWTNIDFTYSQATCTAHHVNNSLRIKPDWHYEKMNGGRLILWIYFEKAVFDWERLKIRRMFMLDYENICNGSCSCIY